MSHAIDYINGFESLINEYKQDGHPSSPEAIYTNTVLKLNGFSSDSIVGSEGFISDVARKFWQGILAIYNWFKSLFKASEERKLTETEKKINEAVKKINSIDPNGEIIGDIIKDISHKNIQALINKLTFNIPASNQKTKTPTPFSFIKYLIDEAFDLKYLIEESEIKGGDVLISGLRTITDHAYKMKFNKFYVALDKYSGPSSQLNLIQLLPDAIDVVVEFRRACEASVKTGSNTITNNDDLLNNDSYKQYSKFVIFTIKNIVKTQNVLIKEMITLMKVISKAPEFKDVDFEPLIGDYVKDLIVEDTVKDLA